MLDKIRGLFRKKSPVGIRADADLDRDYEAKKAGLEAILGPMYDLVGHSIIPYCVGGLLDMYYFPNGIPGTGFASMELIEPDGTGPKRGKIGTYELVSFTKHSVKDAPRPDDEKHPVNIQQSRLCSIMTAIARYSTEAVLNPNETCEVPLRDDSVACVVLDAYHRNQPGLMINGRKHGLMLVVEVHPQEMEYARENGSARLFDRLKANGYYPYSDLDRPPVV